MVSIIFGVIFVVSRLLGPRQLQPPSPTIHNGSDGESRRNDRVSEDFRAMPIRVGFNGYAVTEEPLLVDFDARESGRPLEESAEPTLVAESGAAGRIQNARAHQTTVGSQTDNYTSFPIGPNGLWLHFLCDGILHYAPSDDDNRSRAGDSANAISRAFETRQMVRIVQAHVPDDRLDFEPTIRTDSVDVCVTPQNAAMPVHYLPGWEQMIRVLKRSPDEQGFWVAICAEPNDELPRLVYADWLDEQGGPAGDIVRGVVPMALRYWAAVDGRRWEMRNQRPAHWRLAVTEMKSFIAGGASHYFEEPGYARMTLRRFVRPTQPAASAGEWQCLDACLESGEPLPPFVNYLLIQSVMALLVRRTTAAGGNAS
jgi:uncharacterized protein (TIGR02996 family)